MTTSRADNVALFAIVMLAVMVVVFWTEYELTVIPVPLNDRVPVLKFVPAIVILPMYPCSALVGETLAGDGAPDVTVNAATRVPVCESTLVITTSRAVSAAPLVMVMLAA